MASDVKAFGSEKELVFFFFLVQPDVLVIFFFIFKLFPFFQLFFILPIFIGGGFGGGRVGLTAVIRVHFYRGGTAKTVIQKSAVNIVTSNSGHKLPS